MSKWLRFIPFRFVLYDKIILFIVHNFSGSHRMRFFSSHFQPFLFPSDSFSTKTAPFNRPSQKEILKANIKNRMAFAMSVLIKLKDA